MTAAVTAGLLSFAEPNGGLVTVPCAFQPAFFEPGSTEMVASVMRMIEQGYLAHFDAFSPASRAEITLIGVATDGRSVRANRRLAERRAQTLRRFLITRGVSPERIEIAADHPVLQEEWLLSSTHGRATIVEVRMPREDLDRLMPRDGPVC